MSDEAKGLTHFDDQGRAHMVDVGHKPETQRSAEVEATIRMQPQTLARIRAGEFDKGDVLGVARLAGIGAAKSASTLIPLCHPVRLTRVELDFETRDEPAQVRIRARVYAVDRTGPEMEAMCAASAAALTIYDMCKSVDRGMEIGELRLLRKSGGKSGDWVRGGA